MRRWGIQQKWNLIIDTHNSPAEGKDTVEKQLGIS
jgi:hypothetical protein